MNTFTDTRSTRCDRCAGPLMCGQPGRHWSCSDECEGCHRPVVRRGQNLINCHCSAAAKRRAVAA